MSGDGGINTQCSGLQLSNNSFSASAPGSMEVADNVVISQKGVAQPRRGLARWAELPSGATGLRSSPYALATFLGGIISNYGEGRADGNMGLGYVSSGSVTPYSGGPYQPVDANSGATDWLRMKFCAAGSYLQFCCDDGPRVLETVTSAVRFAGLPRMPDIKQALPMSTATLTTNRWMPYNSAVAYRSVLKRTGEDGKPQLGAPSPRAYAVSRYAIPIAGLVRAANVVTATIPRYYPGPGIVVGIAAGSTFTLTTTATPDALFPIGTKTVASVTFNATSILITYNEVAGNGTSTVAYEADTGARAVRLQVTLPVSSEVTEATPVQIYRSPTTSSSAIEPSDELFQVGEVFPTNTDISNGFIVFDDYAPASVLTVPLYTNPLTSGGYAASANFRPPISRDVASWGERNWYANTTSPQSFRLQLLGVGAADGVQADDTLNVNGVSFTFKATPVSVDQIRLYSSGTPSENIANTMLSVVSAINSYTWTAGQEVEAFYGGVSTTGQGVATLQLAALNDDAFEVFASRPASWTPAMKTATSADGAYSDNNRQPNGLSYSKLAEPEAVPPLNFMPVGSALYPIQRLLPLRNSLIVAKRGDGLYSVTGGGDSFSVQQISTANVIAPDCCAVFADSAWLYTDQGILRVSDSGGAAVVSRQIEVELNALYAQYPVETYSQAFAVPYEVERRIYFFVPTGPGDEDTGNAPMVGYCYSNATMAWTKGCTKPALSGVVPGIEAGEDGNRLYLGYSRIDWPNDEENPPGRILQERKSHDYTDLADETYDITANNWFTDSSGTYFQAFTMDIPEPGDVVEDSTTGLAAKVVSVEPIPGGSRVYVTNTIGDPGTFGLHKRYPVEVQFLPQGNPASRKVLSRLSLLFKRHGLAALASEATVMTDQNQGEGAISATFPGFGSNPFGRDGFGDSSPLVLDVAPVGPRWTNAGQFFIGFRTNEAWAPFLLEGYVLQLDNATGPAGRGR